MFNIVLQQTFEDQQRSDRFLLYRASTGAPIMGAMQQLYDLFTKDWEGDINDTTLAIQITDGIYEMIPSLL